MPLLLQHREGSLVLAVWRIDESLSMLADALAGTTLVEQAMQRFSSAHRQQEWLAVRLLLFHLLGRHVEVGYFPSGKPYLTTGSEHISISHTKGYVAVILGNTPVGIDIERYGGRVHKVAHKFMRTDETAVAYCNDATWGLLLHWSAKEVMFKSMDADEVDFRQHLHILPFEVQQQGSFMAREYRTEQQRSFQIRYLLHPDFVLTWQADAFSCSSISSTPPITTL